jgi:GH24 family phage-related lysozyme (muramidase)
MSPARSSRCSEVNKLQKIKIVQSGWEGFTGLLGMIDFKDGVSVDPVPEMLADRITGLIQFESVPEDGSDPTALGVATRLIGGATISAAVETALARQTECEAMLEKRVYNDYYLPLTKRIKGFTSFPISVQAAQISGAYNFGVGGMVNSSAARLASQGRYREACEAQTAWNKAGGQVVTGLVRRREMGDAQRLGEAELCVSGL